MRRPVPTRPSPGRVRPARTPHNPALHIIGEVDRFGRHHHADRVGRADHVPSFNARSTAVTVFASAPRPTRTARRRSRPRSFPHRAQPGAAAFCFDDGRREKTVSRPGPPERTVVLQHAKAQSGTLAIPAASQIIAAAKVRAVGLRQRQNRRSLRSQRRSVPCPRRSTCVGDLRR